MNRKQFLCYLLTGPFVYSLVGQGHPALIHCDHLVSTMASHTIRSLHGSKLEQSFTHIIEIALQIFSMTLIKVLISPHFFTWLNTVCSISVQVLHPPVSGFQCHLEWYLSYFSITRIRYCDQGNAQKGVYLGLHFQ